MKITIEGSSQEIKALIDIFQNTDIPQPVDIEIKNMPGPARNPAFDTGAGEMGLPAYLYSIQGDNYPIGRTVPVDESGGVGNPASSGSNMQRHPVEECITDEDIKVRVAKYIERLTEEHEKWMAANKGPKTVLYPGVTKGNK